MSNKELAPGIHWVGAVDWDVRDFHGYSTLQGTTYNAFLIVDEKITLIDTVKKSHLSDMVHQIRQIIDPARIDYLIVNHVEPDHSGALVDIMNLVQPEKLICSPMGKTALLDHYHHEDWPYEVVKTGDEVSIGERTLQFLETRMLHWPDSMFTYAKEEKILFSSDAFGQHLATSERFDDEVPLSTIMDQAAKYYANILYLYSPLIRKLLATVAEMNLDIKMIAPDHGVIWRTNMGEIINAYDRWSAGEPSNKALVIYDTMWHSTEKMAKAVAAGLEKEGVPADLLNLKVQHRSDVMTRVLTAGAIVLGSPTLNNGVLPRMAGFLSYLRGLKPQNKVAAAFASYGWSGESLKLLNEALTEMKLDVVDDGLRFKYVPTHDDLGNCVELGRRVGQALKKRLAEQSD
ncbi:MAG: flavodoxin domain-containing protein [Desulfobulbaceae bacterium]|nr:flavodoxin domain-containing protein [Desulfobulbaceae bacterium]